MSRRYSEPPNALEAFRTIQNRIRAVGETPGGRLKWLTQFATVPLTDDAERERLETELQWFILLQYSGWAAGDTRTAMRLEASTDWDIPSVQAAVRELLGELEPDRVVWFRIPIGDGVHWIPGRGVVTVTRAGGVPQVLAAVADLLAAVGNRLRRCETPECRRLFAFTRSAQRRCHPNCGGAERVRAWRAKNREKLSEERHAKYLRKVRSLKGPKVRITRRKRAGKGA